MLFYVAILASISKNVNNITAYAVQFSHGKTTKQQAPKLCNLPETAVTPGKHGPGRKKKCRRDGSKAVSAVIRAKWDHSERRATTGSFLAAPRAGKEPAIRVSNTEMATRITAAMGGRAAAAEMSAKC